MQDRRTEAKERTPIQKLLPGLPGGGSATFFVSAQEVEKICPSCAAIALFNQASSAPSFGGGFKAPLRGSSPLSIFIFDLNPRKMIWKNILPLDDSWYKYFEDSDIEVFHEPVWSNRPIESSSMVLAPQIGPIRGLFWQPASINLLWEKEKGVCDCCMLPSDMFCTQFDKAKFRYSLVGFWPHPHSPRRLSKKNEYYVPSFREESPAWVHLPDILPQNEEGSAPAVLSSYTDTFGKDSRDIQLSFGGYINRQASILERRHERVPLEVGWINDPEKLRNFVTIALEARNALSSALFVFTRKIVGGTGKNLYGLERSSEKAFYQRTEHTIHSFLVQMENQDMPLRLLEELYPVCKDILEESVRPWLGSLNAAEAYINAESYLSGKLKKLKKGLNFEEKTDTEQGGNSDGTIRNGQA